VKLSDFGGVPVRLHHGTVTCEQSRMDVVAIGGGTVFGGCTGGVSTTINQSSPFDPPVVTVDGSALTSLGAGGGTLSVSNSSIDTLNGRVRGGDVMICQDGPVLWDDDGTLTVATTTPNPLPVTFLLANGSTTETKATVLAADDVAIEGASTWCSFDLMRMASTHVDVRSASIVDARSDLQLGQSLTFFTAGTLTIEDGGFVDVAGTLTIRPAGTLNLNAGTLRVGNLVQDSGATRNENGGTLIVPEAGATASTIAAALSLASTPSEDRAARHRRRSAARRGSTNPTRSSESLRRRSFSVTWHG